MPDYVKKPPRYQVGDQLRLKYGERWVGTVTEARGTFRPDGQPSYRIYVPLDPEPLWMEVREDDVEKVGSIFAQDGATPPVGK